MNYRVEQMRECINVVGSQGPVPAWDTQSNGHRERAVPLSLTSVMIYTGIQDTRRDKQRNLQKRRQCEGWSRDWSNAAIDQEMPAVTNKELLYRTWNSAQCYVAAWMGGGLRENGYMYVYGWVPSLFTWNHHNIVNQPYPNRKYKVQETKQ